MKQFTTISILENIKVGIFILDYILRLLTADYKLKQGWISFAKYPFSFMTLIDLISILPSITVVNSGFKLFKLVCLNVIGSYGEQL